LDIRFIAKFQTKVIFNLRMQMSSSLPLVRPPHGGLSAEFVPEKKLLRNAGKTD
jgi:hypothetical protein